VKPIQGRCCAVLLLAGVVVSAAFADDDDATTASAPAVTPTAAVQVTPLRRGSLPQIVSAYGRVQGAPALRERVTAPGAAAVAEIYVRAGQAVVKGQRLIRLRPNPPAAAAYAEARSAADVARNNLQRTRQLSEQHLATQQQLAEAIKADSDARAALAALDAQGANGAKVLRAPRAAVVTALSTAPGAIVGEGDVLLELARSDAPLLTVGVMPAQAPRIAVGDRAEVVAVGSSTPITGRVTLRGAMVDADSGLVPVEIALKPGSVWPGQSAEARITVGQTQGYLLPHAAILVDDRGHPYVMQAVNGKAHKVAVQILAARDDREIVSGPLDAAMPVVTQGNYPLDDGMALRVGTADGRAAP
jgi:RND family efflux transporter MFP subunit